MMKLGKDIIRLSDDGLGIFYHKANDAVLICAPATNEQLDGAEDFDELLVEVSDDEIESWDIQFILSSQGFLKLAINLGKATSEVLK